MNNRLKNLLMWIKQLLRKPKPSASGADNEISKLVEAEMVVDWSDKRSKISKYFTVREACWLPSWGILHRPNAVEKQKILEIAAKMDLIRELLGKAIAVHCWIRPNSVNHPGSVFHKKDYNGKVNGAYASGHISGGAVDWSCSMNCDDVRLLLEPKLEELGIRMEAAPGTNWIHVDTKPVIKNGSRYFRP